MKKTIIFCVFLLGFSAAAHCAQVSKVELTDGSIVNGEIVSFLNGVYTINTDNFGQVTVPAAKIYRIESPGSLPAGIQLNPDERPAGISQQINAYKDKVMSNPESASVINNLANNPQIQDIARDPEILEAAKSGDIQALMKSKKFRELVNNPEIQETVKKLEQ